jgi:hypothetical protein
MNIEVHVESGIWLADRPDTLLYSADRCRRSYIAVLFPGDQLETLGFFRMLDVSPNYLDSRDQAILAEELRFKDIDEARVAKLKMLHDTTYERESLKVHAAVGRAPLTQRMSHMKNLPSILEHCQGRPEHYISQCTFNPKNGIFRRVASVNQLTSLWVDLDYYKFADSELCTLLDDDGDAVDTILNLCHERHAKGFSLVPTMIVRSGRGIYVKWIFSHFLPAVAHPRWRACQDALIEIFRPLQADKAAKDAARVLRIIGSTNSKSNTQVRVIFKWKLHFFDDLAALLLKRERLSATDRQAVQQLTKQFERDKALRQQVVTRRSSMNRKWTGRKWSAIVACELPKLIDLIGPGRPMLGRMDGLCFVVMNYRLMAGMVNSESDFEAQVRELGRHMKADVEQLLSQVRGSWTRYAKGQTPYRLTKSKIRDLLALDPTEDAQILASFPWLLDRNATISVKDRSDKAGKEEAKQSARKLYAQGLSLKQIGTQLQTSPKTIKRWLVSAKPCVDEEMERQQGLAPPLQRSRFLDYAHPQQITDTGEAI